MRTTSAASIVSFGLLGVAALVLLGLGVRSVTTERAAAERTERDRLSSLLGDARRRIEAAADVALARARRGDGDAIVVDGRFVEPPAPNAFRRLAVPVGRSPLGEWMIGFAEEAERAGDLAAAEERYLAVAAHEEIDEDHRRIALHRASALRRAASDAAGAAALARRLLEGLGADRRRTLVEALLARVELGDPDDASLVDDLLSAVGGPDDAVARGLARRASVTEERIAAREDDLARIERLAPWIDGGAAPAVALAGERCVARVVRDDGAVVLAEEAVPALGEGVVLTTRPDARGPGEEGRLVESSPLPRFSGARLFAAGDRAEVLASADERSAALLLALVALLAAGGLAIRQTVRAARREAEAADARARFLQRVGHDLRTPLTLVRMYTETLAEGRVDDAAEAREFAGIAAREAGRLARMVDGVLDLSRLERPEASGRALDVAALAESVVEAHRPLAEEAGLALSLERAGDGAADAVADADALRGAIGNLIENAIKHAPGGGAVDVRVAADGDSVRVSVADRGPGFPPGGEDRMFERFVRGNDVRVPGTGLGLALVREVARRHGGDATARGRAGGGAEVELTLPRETEEKA